MCIAFHVILFMIIHKDIRYYLKTVELSSNIAFVVLET
jgi:hypothetical protein